MKAGERQGNTRQGRQRLDELLAREAATDDVLRAISASPGDVMPVFEAIVQHAVRLCDASFAFAMEHREGRLWLVARTACTPEFARYLEAGLDCDTTTNSGRAAVERRTVQLADFQTAPGVVGTPAHRAETVRSVLAVPLLHGDSLLGVIALWRREVRTFAESEVRVLEGFAAQAVIAIQNARLFNELREKGRELELANTFKSRFLAAASHDLRQPLHALNLFVGQLHADPRGAERERLVAQVDAALGAMNEQFDALLDVSKLDAGLLQASLGEFPVGDLLKRVATTFEGAARQKGLRLRVTACRAWIRSDFILLERILGNLVSNAVRHTASGGVVIGCRRRGTALRVEVWDSGPGIPEDQRRNVFREFLQLDPGSGAAGGLGLGLAIVERLGQLLAHPIELHSVVGKGSRFCVTVPRVPEQRQRPAVRAPRMPGDPRGKLVVVIDDDALVLAAMRGTLGSWGCRVVAAESPARALGALRDLTDRPDLIISDYRLGGGASGIQAIEALRHAFGSAIPAFLMSGDTAPERLREASASHFHLLHKPVQPMALRAIVGRMLSPAS